MYAELAKIFWILIAVGNLTALAYLCKSIIQFVRMNWEKIDNAMNKYFSDPEK